MPDSEILEWTRAKFRYDAARVKLSNLVSEALSTLNALNQNWRRRPRRAQEDSGARPGARDQRDPRHGTHPLGPLDARPVPHTAGPTVVGHLAGRPDGLQFDLRSAQGKLIASLMAALAEFERDLLRERVRSGIAAAT